MRALLVVVGFAAVAIVLGLVGCGRGGDSGERGGEGELSSIWVGDGGGHSAGEILRAVGALAVEENVLIRFRAGWERVGELEVVSRAALDSSMPAVDLMSVQVTGDGVTINSEPLTDKEVAERFQQMRKLEHLTESRAVILVGADDWASGVELVWLLDAIFEAELRWIGVAAG